MPTSFETFIRVFLEICGGLTVVGGAVAMVIKCLAPFRQMRKKVVDLECEVRGHSEALGEIKKFNGIMCRSMLTLMDPDGVDSDFKSKSRKELTDYLSDK